VEDLEHAADAAHRVWADVHREHAEHRHTSREVDACESCGSVRGLHQGHAVLTSGFRVCTVDRPR
jgi:hypothetical protein